MSATLFIFANFIKVGDEITKKILRNISLCGGITLLLVFSVAYAKSTAENKLPKETIDNYINPVAEVALTQVGNIGGEEFWRWYGFGEKVDWCACFVSWCLSMAGQDEIEKFAGCSTGKKWFIENNRWKSKNLGCNVGDIVFFCYDNSENPQHVGIVAETNSDTICTIEGNYSDACVKREYSIDDSTILGYGDTQSNH